MTGKRYSSATAVSIPFSINVVWDRLKDFHDLTWCPSLVQTCEPVGDVGGEQTGAKRFVNGMFRETLRAYNRDVYVIGYLIQGGRLTPDAAEELNAIHVNLKLIAKGENKTELSCSVVSQADSLDAVNAYMAHCIKMFDDLKNTLVEDTKTNQDAENTQPALG